MLKISLTTPLRRLLKGVEQVNEGKLETQVPVGLRDEIGLLTQNFNQMTQSLKKSQDDLTDHAQTLEKKVAKRTSQLQHSLNELKSTQAQLIQSEKMASLGELTAGIAHEIKNPLNFVTNFSELSVELFNELKEEINKPTPDMQNMQGLAEDIAQNLQKISHHGNRAGAIVTSMLEHSRASTGERELTDINELVKEYLDVSYEGMLLKNKNFTALLETQLDPTIEKIEIIPQDLGRVLLNLYNNAFYSVNEKTENLDGTYEPKISVSTKKLNSPPAGGDGGKGKGIEINVKDNGVGIPEDVLDKIYQPFFTTKPAGHGTGLGLSLSYDIITKGYKGELKVETKEGEFAEFIIQLPTA
jgi:signal transduction histidine kinase